MQSIIVHSKKKMAYLMGIGEGQVYFLDSVKLRIKSYQKYPQFWGRNVSLLRKF